MVRPMKILQEIYDSRISNIHIIQNRTVGSDLKMVRPMIILQEIYHSRISNIHVQNRTVGWDLKMVRPMKILQEIYIITYDSQVFIYRIEQ